MKKIFICLALFASVFAVGFSRDFSYGNGENSFALVPGLRLSLLGLEPTFAVDFENLELEAACAVTTGVKGEGFGIAPSVSIAYCSNPFDSGSVLTFGLEYMMVSSSYMRAFGAFSDSDTATGVPVFHAVSLFYKGGYKFTDVFGVLWRARIPLLIGGSDGNQSLYYNITNTQGAFMCLLAGVLTLGVGVQFTIQ